MENENTQDTPTKSTSPETTSISVTTGPIDIEKAANDALLYELISKETSVIIGGIEYRIPKPLTMRFWMVLFMKLRDNPDVGDPEWFTLEIASRAEEMLCWLTGISIETLRSSVTEEEHERICGLLTRQMGEELDLATPFSPVRQALNNIRRAGTLAKGIANIHSTAGEKVQSSSKNMSVEAAGPKS